MLARSLLRQILHNDALTRGLGDMEARVLIEWLVERAERFAQTSRSSEGVRAEVDKLCRRARAIGKFVSLWCHRPSRGAAGQLAAAERFRWPLPAQDVDPCELMQSVLTWESRQMDARLNTAAGVRNAE